MTLEANVLNSIMHTMNCYECPFQCEDYPFQSLFNCMNHWSKILSKINPNVNWEKANDEIKKEWSKNRN